MLVLYKYFSCINTTTLFGDHLIYNPPSATHFFLLIHHIYHGSVQEIHEQIYAAPQIYISILSRGTSTQL